jgi:hypothetical protein
MIRPELKTFVEAMEAKLKEKDYQLSDSWKGSSDKFLWNRLLEEVAEYIESKDSKELIDIANFAFFLWYNREGYKLDEEKY